MAYTMDSKVGEILNDPHARQVLERYAPGITDNPSIGMVKGMTLRSVLATPQAKQARLSEETVQKVLSRSIRASRRAC